MVLSPNASAAGGAAGGVVIVENLPVPADRRVWPEAIALHQAGYTVSVICPKGKGYEKPYEQIDGVHIYRHPRGLEGSGAVTYLLEYTRPFWEFVLSLKGAHRHGFDIIHACNPPGACLRQNFSGRSKSVLSLPLCDIGADARVRMPGGQGHRPIRMLLRAEAIHAVER